MTTSLLNIVVTDSPLAFLKLHYKLGEVIKCCCIVLFILASQAQSQQEKDCKDRENPHPCHGGDVLECCKVTQYCWKGICENCFPDTIKDPLKWCLSSEYNISSTVEPKNCKSACKDLVSNEQWKSGKFIDIRLKSDERVQMSTESTEPNNVAEDKRNTKESQDDRNLRTTTEYKVDLAKEKSNTADVTYKDNTAAIAKWALGISISTFLLLVSGIVSIYLVYRQKRSLYHPVRNEDNFIKKEIADLKRTSNDLLKQQNLFQKRIKEMIIHYEKVEGETSKIPELLKPIVIRVDSNDNEDTLVNALIDEEPANNTAENPLRSNHC